MVSRHKLANGLTVLLDEDPACEVAAVLTHVKTGYFDEEDRLAGISHLLEHMYFKGTALRPGPDDIAQAVKSLGGTLNAFTYYEETGYYVVVPAIRFLDALEIQADALINARIDADELRSETEVVLQEGQQKRDSAWPLATESLYALAHDRHRLRRWRIGEPSTLRSWTRDDVVSYRRSAYRPDNMIVAVAGCFDPRSTLDAVNQLYAALPAASSNGTKGPTEPPQKAPRYRQMRGDIGQRIFLFGFHTVPHLHLDACALDILSAILSDGRASRLYQSVRERQGLATALSAFHQTFRDTGFFTLAAESLSDDMDAAERALWNEVARLQTEPPSRHELDRVLTRVRSRLIFSKEEPLGRARRLAAYEALGGYELEEEEMRRLLAVTPEDVQRVARTYFTAANASLLEYVPTGSLIREGSTDSLQALIGDPPASPSATAPMADPARTISLVKSAEFRASEFHLLDLPGGGAMAVQGSGSQPVVAVEMLWNGGRREETPENAGITNLMLRCILKGNRARNGEAIARAFESMGTSLDWLHGADYWGFGFHVLADRAEEALALATEVILTPDFDDADVAREKDTLFAEIRRAADSSVERALDLLDAAAYGRHPYGLPERGLENALRRLTGSDLRQWHESLVTVPVSAAATGRPNAERMHAILQRALPSTVACNGRALCSASWNGPAEACEKRQRKQTAAAIGFQTVNAAHDDRHALDLIAQVLSGLGGRLFSEVRGRQGLAYTVSAWNTVRRDAGMFVVYTATDPANEDKARAAIMAELARLLEEPVTPEELNRAKSYIAGAKAISLQTSRARARDISRSLAYGRPPNASSLYVERIRALTADDVLAAAQRYLRAEQCALGVLRGN